MTKIDKLRKQYYDNVHLFYNQDLQKAYLYAQQYQSSGNYHTRLNIEKEGQYEEDLSLRKPITPDSDYITFEWEKQLLTNVRLTPINCPAKIKVYRTNIKLANGKSVNARLTANAIEEQANTFLFDTHQPHFYLNNPFPKQEVVGVEMDLKFLAIQEQAQTFIAQYRQGQIDGQEQQIQKQQQLLNEKDEQMKNEKQLQEKQLMLEVEKQQSLQANLQQAKDTNLLNLTENNHLQKALLSEKEQKIELILEREKWKDQLLKEKEAQLNQLLEKAFEKERLLATKEAKLEMTLERNQELAQQLQAKEEQVQQLSESLKATETTLIESNYEVQQIVAQQQRKSQLLIDEKEVSLKEQQQLLKQSQKQCREAKNELAKQQIKNKAFQKQINLFEENEQQLQSTIMMQMQQLEEQRVNLQTSEIELKNQRTHLQGKESELRNQRANLQVKEAELRNQRTDLHIKEDRLQTYQNTLVSKDTEISELQTHIQQHQAQLEASNQHIQQQEAYQTQLKQFLEEREQILLEMQHAFNAQEQYIEDLKSALSTRLGWGLTKPLRWTHDQLNGDKPANQTRWWLWWQMMSTGASKPAKLVKNINGDNIKTLRNAIGKEPPRQIFNNFQKKLGLQNNAEAASLDPALQQKILQQPNAHTLPPLPKIEALSVTVSEDPQNKQPQTTSFKGQRKQVILYISPHLPDYDTSSGGKRATRMLELMAEECEVYAFTMGERPLKYINELTKRGVKVLQTSSHEEVRQIIPKVDVIIYAWYYTYFDSIKFKEFYPFAKIVVDTVDVHWVREERSLGLWDAIDEKKVRENKAREVEVCRNADIVWTVTANDGDAVLKEVPNADIRVVSNIHNPTKTTYQDSNNNNILFIGGYNHYPNISAVKKLVHEILPIVRQSIPDAKVIIAGSKAPEEIVRLGDLDGVEFRGFIEEEDMDALYEDTFITVSPLLAGAGIKGKICESISYMKPVVTNAIGNEGIALQDGIDGLIAESSEDLAERVIKAMRREYDLESMTQKAQHKLDQLVGADTVKQSMIDSFLPPVSICIVTWNRLGLLQRCIESIEGNTAYPNYKILVHSNGCEDGTQEYLKAAAAINPNIIPILSETNDVFVLPNNRMMEMFPEGDAILLNNDTYVTENWLTALCKAAYSSKHYGIAGSKLLYPDGVLQEFGSELYPDGTGRNRGKWEDANDPQYCEIKTAGYVSGCSMYIKRSTINKIGVFDEDFHPCYCEDSDYSYTSWEHGLQTIVTPYSIVYHDEGGTSGTDTNTGFKSYQVINMKKFLKKHKHNLEYINRQELIK